MRRRDTDVPGADGRPIPADDARRPPGDLAAAERLLAGAADALPALDRLAELARSLLGSEAAQLSMLTTAQTVAGAAGLPPDARLGTTPLADSLCTVTATCGTPLVLPDAAADPRVAALPPVASGMVGSYLGVPLPTPGGRTIGALCVFDRAPRAWAPGDAALLEQLARWAATELELAALARDHAQADAQWRLATGAAGIGSFAIELGSGRLECDERVRELYGYPPDGAALTLADIEARVLPRDLRRARRIALATPGGSFDAEYRVVLGDGRMRWLRARGRALVDEAGRPTRLVGSVLDTTEAREAHELVELSSAVGDRLTRDFDVDASLRALAELIVPRLADWTIVSVLERDGTVRDVASWHADPDLRPLVADYAAHRLDGRRDTSVAEAVARTETPEIIDDPLAVAREVLRSPAALATLERLDPASVVSLPLRAGGRAAGALTLFRGRARPPLTGQEITVATAVAQRAGMALDNARLYTEARAASVQLNEANARLRAVADHNRSVSQALQDAMLTQLPAPDHLEMAARYLTAGGTEKVGGDWYDALVLPGGATTVSLGDVVGHDVHAAGVMGQLRSMLRMLAWDRDEPPSAIVARLDGALAALGVETMATLVMLRIEQTEADRAAGLRTLRWTSAGHPAPVLVHADGRAELLEREPELLLGVQPDAPRRDHTCSAPPDSTLILYSDGLVEARDRGVDEGQAELLASLARHHRLAPEALVDRVIADLVGVAPGDDVAVLAVRFGDQRR